MVSRFVPGRVLGYLLRGKNGGGGFAVVIGGFKCYGRTRSLAQMVEGEKDYIILVDRKGATHPVGCMYLSRDRRQFVIKSEQNGVVLAGWAKNLSVMLQRQLPRAPVHERITRREGVGLPPLDGTISMRGGACRVGFRPRDERYGISLSVKEAEPLFKFSVPYRIPYKGVKRGPLTILPDGGRIKLRLRGGGPRRELTTTRQELGRAIKDIERKIYTTFVINGSYIEGMVPLGWDLRKDGGHFVLRRRGASLVVRFYIERPPFPASPNIKIVRQVGSFWVEGTARGGGGGGTLAVKSFVDNLRQR